MVGDCKRNLLHIYIMLSSLRCIHDKILVGRGQPVTDGYDVQRKRVALKDWRL